MTHRAFIPLCGTVLATGFFLTACGPKETTPPAAPPTTTAETKTDDPSFDADKGLYLPEATKQGMGITTGPVVEKTFQAERTMKFQIFREAGEQPLPGMPYKSGYAYASTVLPGQKTGLQPGQVGEVLEKHDSPTGSTARLFQLNELGGSNQTECLVEITDARHQFALAEFCTVRWRLPAVHASTAVPDSALLQTTDGSFVYLQKETWFVRTEVKPGATGEGFTEITEGVAGGDIVVTNPVQTLWLTELKLKSGGEP